MNYAVDKVSILQNYYKGAGDILGWPYYNTPEMSDLYTPLNQMSPTVQALIKGGDPDKAKELLTEAGYPNGFKTKITCSNASTVVDFLSIIKNDLSKVGIDMTIDPRDPSVLASIEQNRTWDEMYYKASKQYFMPQYMFELRPESQDCASFFDSPQTRAVKATIDKTMAMDDTAWRPQLKALTPFILEQSIAIWLPISNKFIMWQPWVQNFYGV